MSVISKTYAYMPDVYQNLYPALKLDSACYTDFVRVGNELVGEKGVFIFNTPDSADTSTVDPAVGAASLSDVAQTKIEVTMALKGNAGRVLSGSHMLTGAAKPEATMRAAVKGVAIGAARTRNAMAFTELLTVPAYNAAWTHDDGVTYSTTGDSLVFLGTATTHKTARTSIATTDTFDQYKTDASGITCKAALGRMFTALSEHGAQPFISADGEMFFPLFLHSRVMHDIKKSLDEDLRYINSGMSLVSGRIPQYNGLAFIVDDTLISPASGSGGINVYHAIAMGQGYLCKAALPYTSLPQDAQRIIDRMPLSDEMEMRIVSGQDTSAYSRNLVWAGYFGYGIGLPKAGIRWEVASSLG